jgi:hypothetical protein
MTLWHIRQQTSRGPADSDDLYIWCHVLSNCMCGIRRTAMSVAVWRDINCEYIVFTARCKGTGLGWTFEKTILNVFKADV